MEALQQVAIISISISKKRAPLVPVFITPFTWLIAVIKAMAMAAIAVLRRISVF